MAIPPTAKRVFKGILYDVYQWEQERFDGTKDTYEGLRRKPSVQVIAVVGDKLIILDEEQPALGKFTSVPGGVYEDDNAPEEAAERELLEETGYKPGKLVPWFTHDFAVDIDWKAYYYIAKGCKKVQELKLDPGEKISVNLVTFEEFIERVINNKFRNRHLSNLLATMKCQPKELEEFKKMIFE